MPSREDHLRKEAENAAFEGVAREAGNSPEWAVTILFYRAMHLVEAYFALSDIHHLSHVARSRAVARSLPEVYASYESLLDLSRRARYESPGVVTWDDYGPAQADFATIAAHLRPLIEST